MSAVAGTWEVASPRDRLPGVAVATGYRSEGVNPGVHRGLPSPYLTFVLTLDGPVVASWDRDEVAEGRARGAASVVGGLHTRPAYVERPGSEHGVQLAVHPLAARAVFGVPAAELADDNLTVEDVWGRDARIVHDQVREAATWEQRFGVLREAIRRRVADQQVRPRADVIEAWRWLAERSGNGSVTDLAAHVHLGNRQLTEVFRQEVGMSPKTVGRLMRFTSVVRRLSGPPSQLPTLAQLAAAQGYADQAHLTREFVEFTGVPPTRWMAEELRFVQDSGETTGTFWDS